MILITEIVERHNYYDFKTLLTNFVIIILTCIQGGNSYYHFSYMSFII